MFFHYTIMQWLFFFYLYCFIGWCVESSYVCVKERKWVNRGFMKGPFLPLYGCGAIMMLLVSKPFEEQWWAVYIAGCVGATVLELITGIVMESLFKVRYWDYTNEPLNFHGYICLGTSLAWGVLTLFMNYIIHQPIEYIVFLLSDKYLTLITILLTFYIVGDFTLSFKAALDLKDILVRMDKIKGNLVHVQKRLEVIITMAGIEWSTRRDAISESINLRKDAISESITLTKDAISESIVLRKDAIAEGIELKKDALTESLNQYRDVIADKLKMDDIKTNIERMLDYVKESVYKKTAEYSDDTKKELIDLNTEYKVNTVKQETIGKSKNLIRRIRNNPSMSSPKYKDSLEELKKQADNKSQIRNSDT